MEIVENRLDHFSSKEVIILCDVAISGGWDEFSDVAHNIFQVARHARVHQFADTFADRFLQFRTAALRRLRDEEIA